MYTAAWVGQRCSGAWACSCPTGPHFPPADVESARVRVLKRRIARRIAALQVARLHRLRARVAR